jgi:hypothetical protein
LVEGEVEVVVACRPWPGLEEEEEEEAAAAGLHPWEGEAEEEGHSMKEGVGAEGHLMKGAAVLEVARVVHWM